MTLSYQKVLKYNNLITIVISTLYVYIYLMYFVKLLNSTG